jgi:hypothetical protein
MSLLVGAIMEFCDGTSGAQSGLPSSYLAARKPG